MTDEAPNVHALGNVLYTPGRQLVEAPVEVGERWPVTRKGQRRPINRMTRRLIVERDGNRCGFCGKSHSWNFAMDHIIPWSAGGPDTSENLRTLCHPCNDSRGNYRTGHDFLAVPVTHACDECLIGWVRLYGPSRHSVRYPGAPELPAYCGQCHGLSFVTDPRRLK